MPKIIIENVSELSNLEAISRVADVVRMGFISGGNQYCYVSTYIDCVVYARDARCTTHSFKVMPNDK